MLINLACWVAVILGTGRGRSAPEGILKTECVLGFQAGCLVADVTPPTRLEKVEP